MNLHEDKEEKALLFLQNSHFFPCDMSTCGRDREVGGGRRKPGVTSTGAGPPPGRSSRLKAFQTNAAGLPACAGARIQRFKCLSLLSYLLEVKREREVLCLRGTLQVLRRPRRGPFPRRERVHAWKTDAHCTPSYRMPRSR